MHLAKTPPGEQLGMVGLSHVPVALAGGHVEIHSKVEIFESHERDGGLHTHCTP
ncbi:MAG: hypothetical protein MJE68_21500 [Proteobacteria bacterium]|nr:hypothetical protein [Pseudomonadota bacterium]